MQDAVVAGQPTSASPSLRKIVTSGKIHKSARRMTAFLLFAVFIDYGGGFGIKTLVGLLALGWVLLRPSSNRILYRHRLDLMIFIGIPCVLGLVHLFLLPLALFGEPNLIDYGIQFYSTISSAVLIILLPLFTYAGAHTVSRQIVIGFRVLAILLLVVFALHTAGIINLNDYAQLARDYRIGFIGLDPRLQGLAVSQRPSLTPRVAYPMPLAFALDLVIAPVWALLMFLSMLVVGSRGIILGAVLIAIAWLFMLLGRKRRKVLITRILPALILAIMISLTIEPIRFRLTGVFLERIQSAINADDLSTQIRLGHLQGYRHLIEEQPWALLIGAGPGWSIFNPVLGARVDLVEMSVVNVALWYGIPYALNYVFWLYRGAFRLWRLRKRPGYHKADTSLVLGASVFWLVGNTNPQMTAPFAIIAYLLITVRIDELNDRDVLHPSTDH